MDVVEDDRAAEALRWIVAVFEVVRAKYQVVGGWRPAHMEQPVPIEVAREKGSRYFDRLRGLWVEQEVDFARSEVRKVLGVVVPVPLAYTPPAPAYYRSLREQRSGG